MRGFEMFEHWRSRTGTERGLWTFVSGYIYYCVIFDTLLWSDAAIKSRDVFRNKDLRSVCTEEGRVNFCANKNERNTVHRPGDIAVRNVVDAHAQDLFYLEYFNLLLLALYDLNISLETPTDSVAELAGLWKYQ